MTACLLRFLSQLQQSTDTSGDRVLGDWRVGETAQLLKGRVGMVESELAGGFKIVRNVIAEDFKGLADLIAGFRGGFGATAHVGVIEVRQTVRLASGLSVGTLSGPFAGGMRGAHEDEHAFDGIGVAQRHTFGAAQLTRLGGDAETTRGGDQRQRGLMIRTYDFEIAGLARVGQVSACEERATPGGLDLAILPLMMSPGRPSTMFLV